MLLDVIIPNHYDLYSWLIIRIEIALQAVLVPQAPTSEQTNASRRFQYVTSGLNSGLMHGNPRRLGQPIEFNVQRLQEMARINLSFWTPDLHANRLLPVTSPSQSHLRWATDLGLTGQRFRISTWDNAFSQSRPENQRVLAFMRALNRIARDNEAQGIRQLESKLKCVGAHQMLFVGSQRVSDRLANSQVTEMLPSFARSKGKQR